MNVSIYRYLYLSILLVFVCTYTKLKMTFVNFYKSENRTPLPSGIISIIFLNFATSIVMALLVIAPPLDSATGCNYKKIQHNNTPILGSR